MHYLNYSKTKFGNRLLRKWLAAPLCNLTKIGGRVDAVEDLLHNFELLE